jgi:fused signal recognition particle receptor
LFGYDTFLNLFVNGIFIMVFNWFRRKFDNSTETDSTAETDQVIEETAVEPEESAEPVAEVVAESPVITPEKVADPAPEVVSADTLAWAKAAYENIKKQQAAAEAVAEPPAPVAVEEAVPEQIVEETITPVDLPAETAVLETPELPIESVEQMPTEPVTAMALETSSETSSEAAPAEIPDTRPAWARESTAQDRLAALRAESIEAPVEEEPIELDEDFLWSARVLAEQGRSPEEVAMAEIAWLTKLRQGLNKTRLGLVNQVKALIGQGPLSAEATEVIETLLLQADVGIEATDYIIGLLQEKLRTETLPPEEAIAYLKQILRDLLDKPFEKDYAVEFFPQRDVLNIWMLTGVNGVGKTTTIGKLAHMTKASGYRCLIAAADTFRAAAVEQVKVWGQRSDIEVIANPGQNTDPAAVVFDAITAAKSRNTELLLVDTAGRLQNKKNLMDELGKIRRIIDKQAVNAQVESLLVLDATLGQNGLRQAQVFAEAAKLSGVVLTKLDGTARGGVALAVVQQLGLPIRFIGAGEGIEDLRPFSSYEFVEALLSS